MPPLSQVTIAQAYQMRPPSSISPWSSSGSYVSAVGAFSGGLGGHGHAYQSGSRLWFPCYNLNYYSWQQGEKLQHDVFVVMPFLKLLRPVIYTIRDGVVLELPVAVMSCCRDIKAARSGDESV